MGNPATLQPKPFTSENQPEKRGRTKGSPNRATVFKKLLKIKIDVEDPNDKKHTVKLTMHEAAALGQLKAAMKGNPAAWKEIQDTLFGKISEEQNLNISGEINIGLDKFREAAQKQYDAKRQTTGSDESGS